MNNPRPRSANKYAMLSDIINDPTPALIMRAALTNADIIPKEESFRIRMPVSTDKKETGIKSLPYWKINIWSGSFEVISPKSSVAFMLSGEIINMLP